MTHAKLASGKVKMDSCRREFVKLASSSFAGAAFAASVVNPVQGRAQSISAPITATMGTDIKAFGAVGDGKTIDTPAINKAIETAAAAGGGTVRFPSGNYLSHSIHLKSNVGLYLEQGAVIIAADALPAGQSGGYDEPEADQPWERYQDYGHNHWHNSLIWGVDLHDISILGPGRIWGRGLSRANGASEHTTDRTEGVGNKSISLKHCHNVVLKDFQILEGGWFGILATGVDNLTIDGLTIDTNRDGMDIDCCRNVRISNCSVNSPWDDAIVLKSSFALGSSRPCENITIGNCYVTGTYLLGTMLDGTWKKFGAGQRGVGTGRIKFGTESNGGFKNIAISNCIFEGCQGLTLESEDGSLLEDLVITNLTMRDIKTAPIFMRLGARLRGPSDSTKTGAIRRVIISNIISSNAASQLGCIITGIPGFPIENVRISNLYLEHRGGGTTQQAALVPAEKEAAYPEPNMFGAMPSQGFFLRHVKNIDVSDVQIVATSPDHRPSFILADVEGADFFRIKTTEQAGVPKFILDNVKEFQVTGTKGVKDTEIADAKHETL
jgi:polygalacturonase